MPGRTPREGTASLGTDSRHPQTYAAGAMLANGAVIREIFKDHVIIEMPSSRVDLSEFIRPEPVFDGGRFAGLKVLPGRTRVKPAELGLASGDIVRSFDGKALKSPDEAWQTLDALSTGTAAVVSVEREGTLTSVFLDGARLSEEFARNNVDELSAPRVPGS